MKNKDLKIISYLRQNARMPLTKMSKKTQIPVSTIFDRLRTNEDDLIYKNEVHYKIEKNRLGGRVGEVDKLYYDARSLKMYDVSEEDLWLEDANVSRDSRRLHGIDEEEEGNGNGRVDE